LGRTNATYRNHLEEFVSRFDKFREGLRRENQKHFDSVWEYAFEHAAAGSHVNSFRPAITAFLSILVGQEKEIRELEKKIDGMEEKIEELQS